MRAIDIVKFIFELIVLIILIVLLVVFVEAFINAQFGKDHEYIIYNKEIANVIDGYQEQVFIPDYDFEYIPVLVVKSNGNNNGNIYLDMYKCNYYINSQLPTLPLWNVSEFSVNGVEVYAFAPDLSQCRLLTEDYIGSCNVNIEISSLGAVAGYPVVPNSSASLPNNFVEYITISILTSPIIGLYSIFNSNSVQVYVLNETNISCSCDNGCSINYEGESAPLECYLSYADSNIQACAELFGLMIQGYNSFITNPIQQNYLTAGDLNINGNTYPYLSLILGGYVSNPILLIENENSQIYFYYTPSVSK